MAFTGGRAFCFSRSSENGYISGMKTEPGFNKYWNHPIVPRDLSQLRISDGLEHPSEAVYVYLGGEVVARFYSYRHDEKRESEARMLAQVFVDAAKKDK